MTTKATFKEGFTIIEVCVIVVVLAILAAIGIIAVADYSISARDGERKSDASSIAKAIERYYRSQVVSAGATYPPTTIGAGPLATFIDSPNAIKAPGQTTSSLVIATSASAQTPTDIQYIYQPLNLNGTLCTTAPCVKFKLYYLVEEPLSVQVIDSMRQQ